jgi:hypothetical protein
MNRDRVLPARLNHLSTVMPAKSRPGTTSPVMTTEKWFDVTATRSGARPGDIRPTSLPGLTRQSIFVRRRWTRGSSPRVTSGGWINFIGNRSSLPFLITAGFAIFGIRPHPARDAEAVA